MAQQLSALGAIEEAHKAEKNVVLEKLEHARVELFTTIDTAMPRISHEKAIVQAALDFVELPGDRERLRSPGLAHKNGDHNLSHAGDTRFVPSKSVRRSPYTSSVADSAPRSLNFTDMDSSGEEHEEVGNDEYDEYYDDYGEVPGSGWIVAGFLIAILGVGLRVNRKFLGRRIQKWREERMETLKFRTKKFLKHQPIRRADQPSTKRSHTQPRQRSSTQREVNDYELQHLEERDPVVISVTTEERTFSPLVTPRAAELNDIYGLAGPQSQQRRHPSSSEPRSSTSTPRIIMSSGPGIHSTHKHCSSQWRWRPHVLLGRG